MAETLPYNYPTEPEFVDISNKSIEKQKDTTNLTTKFSNIMSSQTVQEIQDKGTTMIGNDLITPDFLNQARSDNKLKTKLYMNWKDSQEKISQDIGKPIVPGSTADYKGYDESLFAGFDKSSEAFKEYIDAIDDRQLVARVFGSDSSLPVKGQQLIVNSFKTGDFYTELSRMAKSIPGDVLRLPTLGYMAAAAVRSAVYGSVQNRDEGAFSLKFGQMMADTPGLQRYNNSLNTGFASTITKDMGSRLNAWYKEKFIALHGQEIYDEDHQVANMTMINGQIIPQTDENGKLVYRDRELSANITNDLLEISYGKLAGTEKAGMFFLTMAPFTAGARLLRTAGDIKMLDKLDNLRKNKKYEGLSNMDALKQLRKDRGFGEKAFRKFWQTITLTSDKTRVRDGENVSEHLGVLQRYDIEIGDVREKIQNSRDLLDVQTKSLATLNSRATKGKKLDKIELAEKKSLEKSINGTRNQLKTDESFLALNKQSRKTYAQKNGSGRYDNPYLRSTVADDAIISASMGYAPQLLNWAAEKANVDMIDTRWQELIIGLTAPLAAPNIAGLAARGTLKLADALFAGGVSDIARVLESAKWMPVVHPGVLLNSDEDKFRKILTAHNVSKGKTGEASSPTEDEVLSFKLMSRIYRNMRTEYREKSFQSLIKYNQTMENFENEFIKLGMPEETIAKNMATLGLSMAEVTGLAPLIAYKNRVGSAFTSTDAVKSIDSIAAISMAQEDKLNGIDLLLDTIKESIKREGGADLDSNSELQNMFNFMGTMVANQRNLLTKQKSYLQEQLDSFVNNVGMKEVDSNTIDKIVNLNAMIGGRVLNIKERATEVNKTYNGLMDSVNKQLDEVKLFATEMDEKQLKTQVRRIADVMFDLELGRRKALGSSYYKKVDTYAQSNNLKVDMTKLIRNYIGTVDEFKGKALQEVFGRGTDFFNNLGAPIQRTFNKMAMAALDTTYSRKNVNNLKKTLESQDKIPKNSSDLELALYLKETQMSKVKQGTLDPKNATMINFFDGTVSEAEDVMRYFKDKALRNSKQSSNPTRTTQEITKKYMNIIDEIIDEADPSGELLKLQKQARSKYSTTVGEATDMVGDQGYAGNIIQNRGNKQNIVRKNRKTILKNTEGNYKYKNINQNTPEAPFYNIANFGEKLLRAKTDVEAADILTSIGNEKNRLFSFLGATQRKDVNGDSQYAFDLREPRQQKILLMAEGLLNTIVTHRLAHAVVDDAGKINRVVKASQGRKLENLDNLNPESYNFGHAVNMLKMEKKLTIPVINKNGELEYQKFFDGTKIEGYAVDITQHLKTSQKARDEFVRLKQEITDVKGALNIEAKGKLDEQNVAINALDNITNYVKNPKKFYEEHFSNATPESVKELVEDLVSKGVSMDPPVSKATIQKSLKYMYMRGIFDIAKVRRSVDQLSETPNKISSRSEITDIQSFVNTVLDNKNRDVMQAIMGTDSEHLGFLTDMANWVTYAGGNPRGFAPSSDTKGVTIDSIFSRVFNIARGMVSPLYVGTEIATRLLLEKNQSLLSVALRDKTASKILAKMIKDPEGINDRDIKTLGQRVKVYITMEVLQNKNSTLPTLNEFMGLDDQEQLQVDNKEITGVSPVDLKLGQSYPATQGVN